MMSHTWVIQIMGTLYTPLKALFHRYVNSRPLWRNFLPVSLTLLVVLGDLITPAYIPFLGFYFFPIYLAVCFCNVEIIGLVVFFSVVVSMYTTSKNIPPSEPVFFILLAYLSLLIVFVGFAAVIARMKVAFSLLESENRRDGLTGAGSRRWFYEVAHSEKMRSTRFGDSMVLAIADLDNFKQINDSQGHAVGDDLLVDTYRCMASSLRDIDIIGRIGGDEFAILLPSTTLQQGELALNRLHSDLSVLLKKFSPLVSVSIGAVCVSPDHNLSVSDIFKKADSLMYSVKNTSKNRVVIQSI